jgi:hypothetical protein
MRVSFAVIVLLASLAMGAAPRKKEPAAKSPNELAISKVLDAAQEKVSECVLATAPDGLWTLNVHAEISINGSGQMIACRAVLDPERKGAATTSDCVEKVLRATAYPKTGAGLVTISRVWTFSMQE